MNTPNCKGVDTEIFYAPEHWALASEYCRYCPIIMECRLDFAYDPHAFAGGMTPQQRSEWNSKRKKPKPRKPKQGGRHLTAEQKAEIVMIFDTEAPIGPSAIAQRMGLAKSTVQRVLRAADRRLTREQIDILTGRMGPRRSDGEVTRTMIKKLYEERTETGRKMYTAAEIAEIVGVSKAYVYQIHSQQQRGKI